jgi:hypothetical protein
MKIQRQPLRTPDGWNEKERSLVTQIERIFDTIFKYIAKKINKEE